MCDCYNNCRDSRKRFLSCGYGPGGWQSGATAQFHDGWVCRARRAGERESGGEGEGEKEREGERETLIGF